MNTWIITVFFSTFICVICEFFISDSQFYKLVKGILGVFFLVNLLLPLKNVKIPKMDLNFKKINQNLDNKLEQRIEILAKKKIEKKISDFLHLNGIKEKKIIIHINKSNVTCDISFDKGVENQKCILNKLRKKFGIDFYLKN